MACITIAFLNIYSSSIYYSTHSSLEHSRQAAKNLMCDIDLIPSTHLVCINVTLVLGDLTLSLTSEHWAHLHIGRQNTQTHKMSKFKKKMADHKNKQKTMYLVQLLVPLKNKHCQNK